MTSLTQTIPCSTSHDADHLSIDDASPSRKRPRTHHHCRSLSLGVWRDDPRYGQCSRALCRFSSSGHSPLLVTGACNIPHPSKAHSGGEDAFFVASSGRFIGVADGVGGWGVHGIDSGIYSKKLMRHAERIAATSRETLSPTQVLAQAYRNMNDTVGSTTACILCVSPIPPRRHRPSTLPHRSRSTIVHDGADDEGRGQCILRACNVGDSGFLVIRDGKTIYRTIEQLHGFNFPYQLGTGSQDHPLDGDAIELTVQRGDLIVMASDGLFDNLFDEDIERILLEQREKGMFSVHHLASELAEAAQKAALGLGHSQATPWSTHCAAVGYTTEKGKLDDITVLVSEVSTAEDTFATPLVERSFYL